MLISFDSRSKGCVSGCRIEISANVSPYAVDRKLKVEILHMDKCTDKNNMFIRTSELQIALDMFKREQHNKYT
tara:strand:+ start:1796 stop:2014 length:219 start_codon:yes stop_codon:yes gene_type:complete